MSYPNTRRQQKEWQQSQSKCCPNARSEDRKKSCQPFKQKRRSHNQETPNHRNDTPSIQWQFKKTHGLNP